MKTNNFKANFALMLFTILGSFRARWYGEQETHGPGPGRSADLELGFKFRSTEAENCTLGERWPPNIIQIFTWWMRGHVVQDEWTNCTVWENRTRSGEGECRGWAVADTRYAKQWRCSSVTAPKRGAFGAYLNYYVRNMCFPSIERIGLWMLGRKK